MMNLIEEAIIYATVMHEGVERKFKQIPYILHPIEVAQILSTMTNDREVIAAGILHDIVEDTDGTLSEIKKRFGDRVAFIVSSESEPKYESEARSESWKKRKEQSLHDLKTTQDEGVQMLWLADKLANIRSFATEYSERGEAMWQDLNQKDPEMHRWYYKSIAEILELRFNRTGAFKEFIKHINSIWPGTFDSEKARYKKYKEVSVDGCKMIGKGAKGEVYRYDDELVIKVYNDKNTYADVEREISLSRNAFILGMPTAISFGIVSVGPRYGAMYELVDAETISQYISKNPGEVEKYAKIMADLALTTHAVQVPDNSVFPEVMKRLKGYIHNGLELESESLAKKCSKLLETIADARSLLHGDFHTGNVFLQNGEALLIDMDRVATGHPIVEIGDLYFFYVVLGKDDPKVIEEFMSFSYETSKKFFDTFLKCYLNTDDEKRIREVEDKAALICYIRMINRIHKKKTLSDKDQALIDKYMEQIVELSKRVDTLDF